MSKIEYIICDRCKQKIENEDYYKLDFSLIPKKPEVTCAIPTLDICVDCYKKIYEFIRDGESR